ncbi:MAG TPA: hypothetical protein VF201_07880 [Nitrolancea sp.]
MTFTLTLNGEYLRPAIVCDQCGAIVTAGGFHLSRLTPDQSISPDQPAHQVCGEACYEAFVSAQPLDDEWFAISLDAYLANLIRSLNIDPDAVLAREQALTATEHTRHEAPE